MPVSSFRIRFESQSHGKRSVVESSEKRSIDFHPIPVEYIIDPTEFVQCSLLRGCTSKSPGWRDERIIPLGYCNQHLTSHSAALIQELLTFLHAFELRTRKPKRRLVSGLREVSRHVKAGHVRLLLVAVDVDDDTRQLQDWTNLWKDVERLSVLVVFGMTRSQLTATLNRKGVSQSMVAVINPDGAYQIYQQLVEFSLQASKSWQETTINLIKSELTESKGDLLHCVAFFGHTMVLKALEDDPSLQKMIDYVSSINGCTPLMYACGGRQAEAVSLLLHFNANPTIMDFSLKNALHHAAISGSYECFKVIVDNSANPLALVEAKDCDDNDCLTMAISSRACLIIPLIIKLGVNITVNHLVVELEANPSNPQNLQLLLKHARLQSDTYSTLILECIKTGSLESLRVILKRFCTLGVSEEDLSDIINITLPDGTTATWWAAYLGHVGIARELIRSGGRDDFIFKIDDKMVAITELLEKWKTSARNQ